MPYLPRGDLEAMGFAALGRNVKISDRASIYDAERISIGDNSRIDDFCVVSGNLRIGRNVHFAPLCLVAGGRPGVEFHDFSGLAYGVKVFAQSDDYSGGSLTNPTVPGEFKKEIEAPIIVGAHAIIGTNAVISPGVILGVGTAVGASSLVLKSVEPWTIVAGVPARKLGERKKDLLELERQLLAAEKRGAP